MANVWANLILEGVKTVEEIPARLHDDVIRILEESGYDGNLE